MRTLDEIIESVKLNEKPTYDELRYSLLVMVYVANDLSRWYRELLMGTMKPIMMELKRRDESLYSKALRKPPKDFLGRDNDPANPDYQKFHAWGMKLLDAAINGKLPNQKKPESGE